MKALVTGGTGFIGSHVVDLLVQNGHEVRIFSRNPAIPERLRTTGVSVVAGDLKHPDALLDAMEGSDVLFHIGEIRNTSRSAAERNIGLVERIVQRLPEAKVKRFVFISSITAAGVPKEVPADEDAEPLIVLRDQYTEYKRRCEQIIAERCSGVEFSIVRPAVVYGPRSRYLGRMIEMVKRIGPLGMPFIGNGRNLAPFIQVQDLAAAIYLAGMSPEAAGRTFNITDGREGTWRDLLEAIVSASGRSLRIIPVPAFLVRVPALVADLFTGVFGIAADLRSYVEFLSRDVHFGIDRAQALLGWKPAYTDLAAGVRETVAWFSRGGRER